MPDENPENITPESPQAGRSNLSPAAYKLAARYGMTPEAMERIISSARSNVSPVKASEATRASATEVTPPVAPTVPSTPTHVSARTNPLPAKPAQDLSGGLIAAIVTVVIIGLGVAFSFQKGCFRQKNERTVVDKTDTIPALLNQQADSASTPPVTPSQTSPNDVPPEALAVPQESPPGTTGPTPPKSILGKEQADVGTVGTNERSLNTSSSLDAQEKLAELRASGHPKARIRTVHRHGVTTQIVTPR